LGAQDSNTVQFVNESRALFYVQTSATPYTWHLSVINAGVPRGVEDGAASTPRLLQAGYISNRDWTRFDMTEAVWSLSQTTAEGISIVETEEPLEFGMLKGIPVVGDFNGDGDDEFGVFKDGYWMIDLNGNQRWDSADLMVRLGEVGDRPIVGDWDGDGKDDVGIYGPIWELDREAIAREHGLPNPENQAYTPPKNIPPSYDDANVGSRVMMKSRLGSQRADVVDHVFGMGDGEEVPLAGDWNGNGIRSIGTFQAGVWQLDVNGDGRFDGNDPIVTFGRSGDLPVVGDFDGDGVEEIAIYRSGLWIIDSNRNYELDATDQTFDMGGSLDQPVVGDWDGDGIDEPGLYTESPKAPEVN
jgi:serine-aspartate repeat-containing protein C/D/E